MTNDEARTCMWQLVSAVRALHSNGIVHLDIKPDNIFCIDSSSTASSLDSSLKRP